VICAKVLILGLAAGCATTEVSFHPSTGYVDVYMETVARQADVEVACPAEGPCVVKARHKSISKSLALLGSAIGFALSGGNPAGGAVGGIVGAAADALEGPEGIVE
jgi:hypothetical protein